MTRKPASRSFGCVAQSRPSIPTVSLETKSPCSNAFYAAPRRNASLSFCAEVSRTPLPSFCPGLQLFRIKEYFRHFSVRDQDLSEILAPKTSRAISYSGGRTGAKGSNTLGIASAGPVQMVLQTKITTVTRGGVARAALMLWSAFCRRWYRSRFSLCQAPSGNAISYFSRTVLRAVPQRIS